LMKIFTNFLASRVRRPSKPTDGRYTIVLIPPGHAPTRQVCLPARARVYIKVVAGIVGGMICLLAGLTVYLAHYINIHDAEYAKVERLQTELEAKDAEIDQLHDQSAKMAANLNDIKALEAKISSILKIQPPPQTTASRGARIVPESFGRSTEQDATALANHLQLLQEFYATTLKYEDQLNHTPTILPLEGNITSPFGYRRNPFGGWSSEFHSGIDIACDYGTPVHATADGIVTFAGWDSAYGRRVDIDHGYGVVTFYGHNSRLLVSAGDHVKKGDVIAYSGNSGRSSGPHLHYGAYVNGKLVDPLMFTNTTKEQ